MCFKAGIIDPHPELHGDDHSGHDDHLEQSRRFRPDSNEPTVSGVFHPESEATEMPMTTTSTTTTTTTEPAATFPEGAGGVSSGLLYKKSFHLRTVVSAAQKKKILFTLGVLCKEKPDLTAYQNQE